MSKSITAKICPLLSDIRFWIIVALLIRLYRITNPPLEVAHNWRQTTVTMAARNFYEIDANILYPRVDFAGEKTGITGMEFPLLNYLIYLVSLIFGYEHWYGRLINLVVSSFGINYFYLSVRKYFTSSIAFKASFILLFSIWLSFSRKIMPDTFSVSLVMIGLYYGSNYLDRRASFKNLLIFFLAICAGILSKLPSGYMLILFAPLIFDKSLAIKNKIVLIVTGSIAIVPVVWWYFIWVPYLVDHFGFWHFFMGDSFMEGINELAANIPDTFKKFYDTALKFAGFAFFVFGLIMAVVKRNRKLLLIFLLSSLGFAVVVLKAGFNFPHHSYYIVPFVPVMALVAAFGIDQIKKQWIATIALAAIALEGFFNQFHDVRIHQHEPLLKLETALNSHTEQDDLILINSGQNPTPMYFAHRNGWIAFNRQIDEQEELEKYIDLGLDHVVILKAGFGSPLNFDLEKVHESDYFDIYSVSQKRRD
jgi:hypothetical protein